MNHTIAARNPKVGPRTAGPVTDGSSTALPVSARGTGGPGESGAGERDDGWVYQVGGTAYRLAASAQGWRVTSRCVDTGSLGVSRCFGDRMVAERVYFAMAADGVIAHLPYACDVWIGGAHLVLVRDHARWHLAERSAGESFATCFDDELAARQAWLDRGTELLRRRSGVSQRPAGPSSTAFRR